MARSIRHARRSILVTAVVAATIAVSVLPASASFPDQGPRVLFARAKMPPARTLSPSRGIGALDLFTMKPNGDDQVRVVKTDALLEYGGHWSPNGARIVVRRLKGKGNLDIYTAMADGTKRKQLTTTATNYSPNWSKNGKQIVWTRLGGTGAGRRLSAATLRGIDGNLMVMNADGTDKHSIFTGLATGAGVESRRGPDRVLHLRRRLARHLVDQAQRSRSPAAHRLRHRDLQHVR